MTIKTTPPVVTTADPVPARSYTERHLREFKLVQPSYEQIKQAPVDNKPQSFLYIEQEPLDPVADVTGSEMDKYRINRFEDEAARVPALGTMVTCVAEVVSLFRREKWLGKQLAEAVLDDATRTAYETEQAALLATFASIDADLTTMLAGLGGG